MENFLLLLILITSLGVYGRGHLTEETQDQAAKHIPLYTGKVYPVPQKCEYFDDYLDFSKLAISKGHGLDANDPRLKFFLQRLSELDAKVSFSKNNANTSFIEIVIDPDQLLEGYEINCQGKKVEIKVRGWLGIKWAFSSLTQLLSKRNDKAVLRKTIIKDYPHFKVRGFINNWYTSRNLYEKFMNTFKLNSVHIVFPFSVLPTDKHTAGMQNAFRRHPKNMNFMINNRPPQIWLEALTKLAKQFNRQKVEWNIGLEFIRNKPKYKMNSSSKFHFANLMTWVKPIVKNGGNITVSYDDDRFPIHPAEKKKFGSAREADKYFLNKLYKAIKAIRKDAIIYVLPPFYWGPGACPAYGESREEYLKMIGDLPKDIKVWWTGKNVWTPRLNKQDTVWITKLIKRKPEYWLNGGTGHHNGVHYGTDSVEAWTRNYKNYDKDISSFYFCACFPQLHSTLLATHADYLWNPGAYSAKKSIRTAFDMILGEKYWADVDALNKALSKIEANDFMVSAADLTDKAKSEKDIKEFLELYNEKKQKIPFFEVFLPFSYKTHNVKLKLDDLANKSKIFSGTYAKLLKKCKDKAFSETKFNSSKDIFFSPYSLRGGWNPKVYRYKQKDKRLAIGIRGKTTAYSKMQLSFKIKTPPTKELYKMIICAQDDDDKKKCKITIDINGNTVFSGPNMFERFKWNKHTFNIKGVYLKEGKNTITIKSLEKDAVFNAPPFFMVNYIVLKGIL